MRPPRRSRLLRAPMIAIGAVMALVVSLTGVGAQAADLSQFQPGNIISDSVFFNSGTMSEAEIQAFLEAGVPRCQSGYVCLRDAYDTTRSTAADAMCGAYSGGYRERASTIIYKVARACGINPQVILVMLQKEQGLVTHTWPSDWRYTIAMGQGCPDTAACDTQYYGFFNQVYGAAWQLKRYANPPGTRNYFNWYAPGNTWNIRWSPNASCGSSPVYVQNQATANLYYYTPYQPNAAALNAGYGEGDGCSAYGNRNFFQYFHDWFGSAVVPTIASVTNSTFVTTLGPTGAVLGYPFLSGGRWGTPVSLATTASGTTRLIAVGDLDGDGTRDLLGVTAQGAVSLYPGASSTVGYGAAVPVSGIDWSGAALITSAGDVDGDGNPDVYTTDSAGALLLWRGTDAGRFRAPLAVGNGWGMMNSLVGGADMTRDGVPDLVARSTSGVLYFYAGDGRGGFLYGSAIGYGWGGMASLLSPGDFSGDGNPDLLARDGSGRLWYYWGTGTGRIAGGTQVGTGWGSFTDVAGAGPASLGRRAAQPGSGDLDADGARDVVATTGSGQVLVYRGDGRGSWRGSYTGSAVMPADSRLVTLGDFTGDGLADLGQINADGTFDLLPGIAGGGTGTPVRIGNGWNGFTAVVGGIDFTGDRRMDVIVRDPGGTLLVYPGDGVGGWASNGTVIGSGWGSMTAIFAAGDFDRDGFADVIARGADGGLWIYPGNGQGSWLTPRQIGYGWSGFTAIFSPGDFDRVNGPDVLARTAGGQLIIYRNNGAGGWASSSVIGNGWNGLTRIG